MAAPESIPRSNSEHGLFSIHSLSSVHLSHHSTTAKESTGGILSDSGKTASSYLPTFIQNLPQNFVSILPIPTRMPTLFSLETDAPQVDIGGVALASPHGGSDDEAGGLDINQATFNNEAFDDNPSKPTRLRQTLPLSPSSSGGLQPDNVNPVSLHALARKGSQADVDRFLREQNERGRRFANAPAVPSLPNTVPVRSASDRRDPGRLAAPGRSDTTDSGASAASAASRSTAATTAENPAHNSAASHSTPGKKPRRGFFRKLLRPKGPDVSLPVPPKSPLSIKSRGMSIKSRASETDEPRRKMSSDSAVKVKTKNRVGKDFARLCVAQELTLLDTGAATRDSSRDEPRLSDDRSDNGRCGKVPPHAAAGAWVAKFSPDGRYLAVGGKDAVVRVWAVLTDAAAREAAAAVGSSRAAPLPVFEPLPVHEFTGHSADVLDLAWSPNNFLLSSSMDKSVRLWHVSKDECLCAFQHLDFVTSIAFHPRDDRFFLSGSLDCKLRLWNIPERRVDIWTELSEIITSVAFSADGRHAIAGSFVGLLMFFEVTTFKLVDQVATSERKKKGRKITGIIAQDKYLLVSSNDSRIRLFTRTHEHPSCIAQYAGHENTSSQIRASFSPDADYVVSGSEDRNVYIWPRAEPNSYESFHINSHTTTCAIFAPASIRAHLAAAGDPVFSEIDYDADGVLTSEPAELHSESGDVADAGVASSPGTSSPPYATPVRTGTQSSFKASDVPVSSGKNAILIVCDDASGVVTVLRNSVVSEGLGRVLPPRSVSRKQRT